MAQSIGLKILSKERVRITINTTSIAAWIKNPFRKPSENNHCYNYRNFLFFTRNNMFFIEIKYFFELKLDIVW